MEALSVLSSIAATLLLLCGYWIYNAGIYKGTIVPNPVTWFLWAIGGVVEAGSYWTVTNDPVKRLFPTVCAGIIVFIFLSALFKGKLERPERVDLFILILDLEIGVLLLTSFFRPEYINMLVQVDVALTFAPIIRSTWIKPEYEDPKPWFVWSLSYLLLIATVFMRFEDWWDLAYPTTAFVLHLTVGLLARQRTVQS